MMKKALSLLALGSSLLLAAAEAPKLVDTGDNLLQNGKFEPLYMHGKPTAAFGWYLRDQPRSKFAAKTRK